MSKYKYSFDSRVRYSELDTTGKLSIPAIINYMQDCSTFQSEMLGVGMNRLKEKKRAWLLAAWNIDIDRAVSIGTDIRISTWADGFGTIYGDRNFTIEDGEGNICAKAKSLWVYVNTENRHPSKIDKEELDAYGTGEELDMEPAKRKLPTPAECEEREPFKIKKAHLDHNGHVNNSWYITLSMEYLPKNFEVKNVKVVYQKELIYGNMVYPYVSSEEEKIVVVFKDCDGRQHSIVEFNS